MPVLYDIATTHAGMSAAESGLRTVTRPDAAGRVSPEQTVPLRSRRPSAYRGQRNCNRACDDRPLRTRAANVSLGPTRESSEKCNDQSIAVQPAFDPPKRTTNTWPLVIETSSAFRWRPVGGS